MKTLRLFLLPLFATLLMSFSSDMEWAAARRLSWNDYTGAVNSKSKFSAMSTCAIAFQINGKGDTVHVMVKSLFYPGKSWVKTKDKSEALLAHEQLHFDITELYARKLRKEVLGMKLDAKHAQKQLMNAYQKNFKALTKEQTRYDAQSKHSINKEKQQAWSIRIHKELEQLSGYTASSLHLKLSK
jgi:hypothetical protein